MNKFIRKIIRFSLPIVLCLLCLEIVLRVIPDDYNYKANYLEDNAFQIEELILGSSHSFFGVNPQYMNPNTFNASHVSQSLDYDYEILMNNSYTWKKLKRIYLPISYFTMWSRLNLGGESWRCKLYYNSYGIDNYLSFNDYFKITDKLSQNIKQASAFIIKRKNKITCNDLGWGFSYKSEESKNLDETGRLASNRHTKDIHTDANSKIYEENIKYLNEIAMWSKKKGIEVVFLTLPAYKSYRDGLNSEQLSLTTETINNMANKYENCTYINLMEATVFKKEDFYDGDHLNEIGAEKLSKLITDL